MILCILVLIFGAFGCGDFPIETTMTTHEDGKSFSEEMNWQDERNDSFFPRFTDKGGISKARLPSISPEDSTILVRLRTPLVLHRNGIILRFARNIQEGFLDNERVSFTISRADDSDHPPGYLSYSWQSSVSVYQHVFIDEPKWITVIPSLPSFLSQIWYPPSLSATLLILSNRLLRIKLGITVFLNEESDGDPKKTILATFEIDAPVYTALGERK